MHSAVINELSLAVGAKKIKLPFNFFMVIIVVVAAVSSRVRFWEKVEQFFPCLLFIVLLKWRLAFTC